jgi:tetratricopeptide (TPR) repeat protein
MAASILALLQEAAHLHRQGRLSESERLYRMALARQSDNYDALYLLGMLTMQQGRLDEAAGLAAAAVKRKPGSPDALMLLGSIMLAQKHADRAIGYFDRAVVAQPGNAEAHYNRAVARAEAGQWPQALADYDQVVAANPRHAEGWFNRGNVLARLARHEQAVESYDRALALAPNAADSHNNRGNALAALGRHELALASFDRALTLQPKRLDTALNRAASLRALGRNEEALAACERVLAAKPDHVGALAARGNVLHAMARHSEALDCYDRALLLAPNDVEVINNRGISLLDMMRFEDALANAERALALASENAKAHFGRANALHALARYDEAAREFETAIALKPDFAEAKWNLSMSYLFLGRLAQGWELYEHRWSQQVVGETARRYAQPRWQGARVPGVLLAWAEQGLGDQILHGGLLAELMPYAERLVVEIEARLVPLFARSLPDTDVVAMGPKLHEGRIDAQVPFGSLPRWLRKGWDAFPQRDRGYLLPDAGRVRGLRERLASDGRKVIGLSWISKSPTIGSRKSAELKDFEPLLRLPGYRFIDLQYGDTAAERGELESALGLRVERLADIDNLHDIDGLAALVGACDAVLTVSNTTAHLAGAVGTPTWVMVPFGRGHLWYWFLNRPRSPWYPRVQVRRQGPGQSWVALIAQLAPEVAAAAAGHVAG